VLAGAKTPSADYVKKSFKLNKESNPEAVHELVDAQSIKEKLPSDRVKTGTFEDRFAYFNGGCGYARARGAMDSLCAKVRAMGVTFTVGKATSFQYQDDEITGVHLEGSDGRLTVAYDFYIVAAGSWTAQLLPEFIQDLVSSGQVVGTIQLTPEEADEYRSAPVLFSMDSGFYVFPPTVRFPFHHLII
jgi:sarcosine oxidase/L-pipecolate oxidase